MKRRSFLGAVAGGLAALGSHRSGKAASTESSETRFARWWCQLNRWQWSPDWGEPPEWVRRKLEDLTGRERYDYRCDEYNELSDWCYRNTTPKEKARVWHMEFIGRTKAEFNEWWDARGQS